MTIFVANFHFLASRNLLATGVLKSVADGMDGKVVVFVPYFKEKFLNELYGTDNLIFVGFNERLKKLKLPTFALIPTYAVKLRLQERLGGFKYFINRLITILFSRSKLAHKIVRFIDQKFSPKQTLDSYIEIYKPSCVFVTDVFGDPDALFIQTAKEKGIFSIGMVRSWDNTTTKGLLRAIPDKLIVNNEIIRDEAIKFHDVKKENIFVSGIPQFDLALRGYHSSKEEFFKKINANRQKRLLLFAPAGCFLSDTDWQVCEILKRAIYDKKIPSDVQFLVRSHPADPAPLDKFQADDNFIIDRPGTYFKKSSREATKSQSRMDFVAKEAEKISELNAKATEMSFVDQTHLLNSLYNSEIIIYVNSTIGLDSLPFDKPQIMIEFDGWEKKPYIESVKRYHDEDHMVKYLKTGAVRIAHSPEELFYWINAYLKNPALDRENRQKAMKEQLYKLDGQSSKRISDFIINQVK